MTSTIALDVATGAIKGYHQYHPNDSWDWDEVSPPILVDYQRNGRTIKGLIDVARDGYIWFLERSAGPIKFVEGKPFVYQDVFRSLDPVTGKPDVDPEKKPMTGTRADFCPGVHGGKNWPPIAFSPRTRMIYIPPTTTCADRTWAPMPQYTPGRPFVGVSGSRPFIKPGADHVGEVQAWNVDTGQKVWTHVYDKSPNWGGMLVTAGGIVFSGGTGRSQVPCVRCINGKAALGVSDELRHPGATDDVQGGWQAVRGRGVGLGRRFARDAGDVESTVSRRVSRSARGWSGLGFRR